ncbi:MAG: ABC transporter ATP-binding protein [Clostridia bacterium]|nr:ABC transporter ATP-binding protein [Clostridia bacterium]
MYSINELISVAVKANVCEDPKNIRIIFPYDLHPDNGIKSVGGVVAATDDKVFVIDDGEIKKSFSLCDVENIMVTNGIGCIFIEAKMKDGSEQVICRGSGSSIKLFKEAGSDLIRLVNGKLKGEIKEYAGGNACPKCGRPLLPGSSSCMRCTGKSSYVKRLLKIAYPWRWMIILSVLLYFVTAVIGLIPPMLNQKLVDDYIQPNVALTLTTSVLIGFVGVIVSMLIVNLINRGVSIIRSLLMIDAGAGIITKLRQMTFDKIQSLSIGRINARTSGELINRVYSDTQTVKNFLVNQIGEMIQMVVTLITVGLILFVYNWKLALLVLCPMPVIVIANRYIMQNLHKYFKLSWVTSSKASSILHDTFSGIRVVKSFGMENKEIGRYKEITDKEREVSIRSESFAGSIMPIISFFLGIGEFFIMFYVGNKIIGGEMTLGEMSKFSAYVGLIYAPLRWISRLPNIISRTGTSLVKIFDILDEENEVEDKPDCVDIDINGEITFDDLSFSYDETNPVLKNLSFTINQGEMIGIVGRSGVGKSTLINLVMRMYDPTFGAVKIDGVDLRDISQSSLRSQIGVVLQETYLFSGTIYDNISYAKAGATKEEVIAAAKLAGAHKFIVKLPDGYNTRVGERGNTLSGGERQRVSIARALLRNPKILILDEATSALDTETEKEVQDVLYKLTRGRTTLAIAHRLSTLRNSDKILVLDKGRLAEFGPHDELMAKKGIYYDLVMAQRQMSKMSRN